MMVFGPSILVLLFSLVFAGCVTDGALEGTSDRGESRGSEGLEGDKPFGTEATDGVEAAYKDIHRSINNTDSGAATLSAWDGSYLLASYLAMFRATQDSKYLDQFVDRAEKILALRADFTGEADHTGRVRPVWIARNSKGEATAYLLHSGLITYPLAEFALMVQEDKKLQQMKLADGKLLFDKAQFFREQVVMTVDAHAGEWSKMRHNYLRDHKGVPPEEAAAFGRTLVVAHELTKNSDYQVKALALAKHLKDEWLAEGKSSERRQVVAHNGSANDPEDTNLGFGELGAGFAFLTYKYGYDVFTKADMKKVVHNLLAHQYLVQDASGNYIRNRTVERNPEIPDFAWILPLAEIDERIVQVGFSYYQLLIAEPKVSGNTHEDLVNLMGLANLKYYSRASM